MAAKKKKAAKNELIIRVEQNLPTVGDLGPEIQGSKYMLPKSWMSEAQVLKIVQRTPAKFVYRRAGRGGKSFDYVSGTYITKVLNFVFGWNWDFDVVTHGKEGDMIWVLGKLTCKDDKGHTITKTQFGRAEVKYLKGSKTPVDYGNDLKAATTDSLKKCASMLGIASDVYGKAEFKEEVGKEIKDEEQGNVVEVSDGEAKEEVIIDLVCVDGGEDISSAEAEFSLKIFGRMLCRAHQAMIKNVKDLPQYGN